MTTDIKLNGSSINFQGLKTSKSLNSFENIRFLTDNTSISGNESFGIYSDDILQTEGIILDFDETEDGYSRVSGIEKAWKFKTKQVPYTEFTYENMEWNRIVKELLFDFDWCSNSMLYPTVINSSNTNWSVSYSAQNVSIVSFPKKFYDGSLKLNYSGDGSANSYFYHNISMNLSAYQDYDLSVDYYIENTNHLYIFQLRFIDSNESYNEWQWGKSKFELNRMATLNISNLDLEVDGNLDWSDIRNIRILILNNSYVAESASVYINLMGGNIGRPSNLSTIPYIHFVHDDIQNAIGTTIDMVDRYYYIDYENSRLITSKRGEINTSEDIIQKYIGSIDWNTEYSNIYNFVYIKGGRENGSVANDYITEFAYDGESFKKYGKREFKPHVDEEMINRSTCKLMANFLRDKYKDPRINGALRDLPYQSDLKAGYTVNVSNTDHDGEYLIQRVSNDFESMTSDIILSNTPIAIENEIKDIQNNIDLIKRHIVPLYTDGKPIYISMDEMRRTTSLNTSEMYNDNFYFNDCFGDLFGGLKKSDDSIHRE